MDRTEILAAARADSAARASHLVAILRTQPHLETPLGGGSEWTVRDAAVHVACGAPYYVDFAAGVPSPLTTLDRDVVAAISRQFNDDVAEADPGKVADMLADGVGRFLRETAGWSAGRAVNYHAGSRIDLADLTVLLGQELTLHGYDVAATLGLPWPIEPGLAVRCLGTLVPLLGLMPDAAAVDGHTAAYRIELRGGPALTARFTDGTYAVEPPGGPVDCVLSADPVALLLVLTGRLTLWSAVALGLVSGGGDRPELAYGFPDLFRFC